MGEEMVENEKKRENKTQKREKKEWLTPTRSENKYLLPKKIAKENKEQRKGRKKGDHDIILK